ncbi:hypothetical protein E2C01_028633 [Portunus trituberculatus]|uniref:Uncharacterized protein n=1 Tax=Portunus trituberculatus TaxID=210409 RepID=A0A5B7EP97_PORTR|nr:hypothetical protein [Portunus trituberculatus]
MVTSRINSANDHIHSINRQRRLHSNCYLTSDISIVQPNLVQGNTEYGTSTLARYHFATTGPIVPRKCIFEDQALNAISRLFWLTPVKPPDSPQSPKLVGREEGGVGRGEERREQWFCIFTK